MEHTPIIETTRFIESDRVTVCADCGNDLESWKVPNKGNPFYTSWGFKKDTKSRGAWYLISTCPAK
jgi:hypothetical protein